MSLNKPSLVLPDPVFDGDEAVDAAAQVELKILAMLAASLEQNALSHAAAALAEALMREQEANRVSIGLRAGRTDAACRLCATSDGPAPEQSNPISEAIADAMDEAVDQAMTITCPASSGKLAPISLAHDALRRHGARVVCTLPLVVEKKIIGAICLEWIDSPPVHIETERLELLAHLAAPVLALFARNERSWLVRVRDSARAGIERLKAPGAGRLRLGVGLASLAILAGLAVPLDEKIGGRARLEGQVQRVLVAPVDGFIKATHARPGDPVRADQLLLELAQEDLGLERQKWASELAQFENAYAAAFARSDRTEMVVNQARAEEARLRLAMTESRLSRARLLAPFDGVLIQGDLARALGSPVRKGDVLMTVAPANAYRVIVEVDESDIARVAVGQRGELAVSALPWDSLPIKVERVTPLASVVDGANVFEVEASLDGAPGNLQPGLRGNARLVVGERAPLTRLVAYVATQVRLLTWPFWI